LGKSKKRFLCFLFEYITDHGFPTGILMVLRQYLKAEIFFVQESVQSRGYTQ